jgi:hypothetical protein
MSASYGTGQAAPEAFPPAESLAPYVGLVSFTYNDSIVGNRCGEQSI